MNHEPTRTAPSTRAPLEGWLARNVDRIAVEGSGADEVDPGTVSVKCVDVARRPSAHLHRYVVTSKGRSTPVLVKERTVAIEGRFPSPKGHWALFSGPNWNPPPNFERRPIDEFAALETIDTHFSTLADPRFGTVRPIALDRTLGAFAMSEWEGAPLDRYLDGKVASSSLPELLENTGAWLREFHSLEDAKTASSAARPVHHSRREDLRTALREVEAGLPETFLPAKSVLEFSRKLRGVIETTLPEEFPIGLCHGDFWSGNVLVDRAGRIAVIDTFAVWRSPIYEDLTYFLFALRTALAPRARSGTFEVPPRALEWESHFLRGYFGEAKIPLATLRVFELCVLLRKWAGRCERGSRARGWRGVWKRARLAREARQYQAIAAWLFSEVAAHGAAPHGDAPHGDAPHGDAPHGAAPHGDAPHGEAPRAEPARSPIPTRGAVHVEPDDRNSLRG